MIFLRFCSILFLVCNAASAPCQVTDLNQALQSQFKDNVLMLRGFPTEGNISFDSNLNPKKHFKSGSWTLAEIRIRSIQTKHDSIILFGDRVGFAYDPKTSKLVKVLLNDEIKIHVDGPFTATEQFVKEMHQKIFVPTTDELATIAPDYWKPYLRGDLPKYDKGNSQDPKSGATLLTVLEKLPDGTPLYKVGDNILRPKPVHTPDPVFPEPARQAGFQGVSLLRVVIDEAGLVSRIHIEKPAGMGLDEEAVAAVKNWKFKPASKDGAPVSCIISVEVNFTFH